VVERGGGGGELSREYSIGSRVVAMSGQAVLAAGGEWWRQAAADAKIVFNKLWRVFGPTVENFIWETEREKAAAYPFRTLFAGRALRVEVVVPGTKFRQPIPVGDFLSHRYSN